MTNNVNNTIIVSILTFAGEPMNKRLIYEVKAVSNIVKRTIDSRLSKDLKYEQLTTSQCKILNYLSSKEDTDIYQKDIEKVFSIRRSTATKTLQLMEKNGFYAELYNSQFEN